MISHLLTLSRPRFWIYTLGPALLGIVSALPGANASWTLIGVVLFFTFPANLFIYGINDAYDYETDVHNSKKKGYESILNPTLRAKTLRYIWGICLVATCVFFPTSLLTAVYALLFLVLGWGYSAPPMRAKIRPFFDSASNILYAVPGFATYALLTNTSPPWSIILASGCWCAAMHAYSAAPDIAADTKAGIATIATTLGRTGTLVTCLTLYVLSAVLAQPYLGWLSFVLAIPYVVLMILSLQSTTSEKLLHLYSRFPAINTAVGFSIFAYTAYLHLF